ncbi:hypothetical protein P3S68_010689 [Capsicum galapagoense]
MERVRREFLCQSSQTLTRESTFDATSERECLYMFFPSTPVCVRVGSKIFLFLYRIEELNVLVDAVEGKLSAIYRWARQDLGLALSSYVNKERQLAGKLSCKPEESVVKETSSGLPTASVKKEKNDGNAALLTKASSSAFPLPKDKQSREPLASFMPDNTSHGIEGTKNGFQSKCDESMKSVPAYTTQVTQLSVDGGSCSKKLSTDKREVKGTSGLGDGDVILLSDDEGEEENNSIPSRDTVGKQTVNWGNSDKPVATASIDGARVTEDGVNGSLGSDSVKF